ncbi:MAG: hypothetical protein CMN44_09615 [SAR116 cluster bacterium]|nr:hypothetical protein [SAR116 cluster bacterium]RPH08204.1 MAG: hypothetical protein CBC14_009495 [Alphaproteobacteria bacterium TMED54]|tara:strand:- start:408 stop:608 length:201 start_codon:yes stop_codon:yes gene_type:complete
MVNFKLQLENESFSLIQTETSHFEKLYSVAGNPVIWEQHPENDKGRGKFLLNFFRLLWKTHWVVLL